MEFSRLFGVRTSAQPDSAERVPFPETSIFQKAKDIPAVSKATAATGGISHA